MSWRALGAGFGTHVFDFSQTCQLHSIWILHQLTRCLSWSQCYSELTVQYFDVFNVHVLHDSRCSSRRSLEPKLRVLHARSQCHSAPVKLFASTVAQEQYERDLVWSFVTGLNAFGVVQGPPSPRCSRHVERGLTIVIHGDDFTTLVTDDNLTWIEEGLQKYFEVELRGRVGFGEHELKDTNILKRSVRVDEKGLA